MWPSWSLCLFALPQQMFILPGICLFACLGCCNSLITISSFYLFWVDPLLLLCWKLYFLTVGLFWNFCLFCVFTFYSISLCVFQTPTTAFRYQASQPYWFNFLKARVILFWYTMTLWGGWSISLPIEINHHHTMEKGDGKKGVEVSGKSVQYNPNCMYSSTLICWCILT